MSEETEVVTNPIEDLVQAAMDKNYATANEIFSDMMSVKVSDALDQEKVGIAGQIFNGDIPEEDDIDIDDDDLELDDDEISDEDDEVEN
jgi:hypothetical protein